MILMNLCTKQNRLTDLKEQTHDCQGQRLEEDGVMLG